MPISEEKFKAALADKKIPVLILDSKWHQLFKKAGITPEIEKLEKELTELLKKQGRINTEIKNIKKLKGELMNNIVSSMDGSDDKSEKKVSDSKRLINESNEKMDALEDELLELPRQIDSVNKELMLQTMALCYVMSRRLRSRKRRKTPRRLKRRKNRFGIHTYSGRNEECR